MTSATISNTLLAIQRNLNQDLLRKRIRRFQIIRSWKRGLVKLPYPPEGIQVDVTNACNLRCVFCRQSIADDSRPKGFMKIELLEKIAQDASDKVFLFQFVVTGEPLLHKQITQMLRVAKAAGLKTNMHTNGTLLNEQMSEEIIRAGLDELSFSFDTADKEQYEKLRRGAKFDDVVNKMRTFMAVKKRLKSKTPMIIMQNLRIFWEDPSALEFEKGYKELLKSMGMPVKFFVKHYVNPAGKYNGSNFALGDPEKFFKPLGKTYTPCQQLWRRLSISWDGKVLGCCNDDGGEYLLGDLNTQSIMDVWNGERMIGFRQQHLKGEAKDLKLCKACPSIWK